jgi:hypothetical protein
MMARGDGDILWKAWPNRRELQAAGVEFLDEDGVRLRKPAV